MMGHEDERHGRIGDETVRRLPDDETIRRPWEDMPISPENERMPASGAEAAPAFFPGSGGTRLLVQRPLAPGGEGELYLCLDGAREVVVKVLNYDCDEEILAGFVRQQEGLVPLHLMPLLYVGNMQEVPGRMYDRRRYVVSPYYPGEDLSQLENARRINPSITFAGSSFSGSNADYAKVHCDYAAVDVSEFTRLVGDVHTAMKSLHSAQILPEMGGIIHRDIRPQNILADESGNYVLGDFGLVSALGRGVDVKFTQRFGVSHGYSPPEAYSDRIFKQSVTRKYDYFSLGMTLAHVVGGRPLYIIGRDAHNLRPYEIGLTDFYEIIALSNVVLPAQLPPRIANLLRGLLCVSIEDRFGAEEVDEWLAGGDPVVHELDTELQSGIMIKVNRRTYRGEREVALAMVEHWDLFVDLVAAGHLQFQWQDPDVAYQKRVREAVELSQTKDPQQALTRILRAVWPQIGHVIQGRRYENDHDLGQAMLAASDERIDVFASYLCAGGLSSWKETLPDTQGLETIRELEKLAAVRPKAAVRICGSVLAGTQLPPFTAVHGSWSESFADLPFLSRFIRRELEGVIGSYLQRTAYELPPLMPVPGVYASKDNSQLAIVQFDGTVIADANSFQEQPVLTAALSELLAWALPQGRLDQVADVNEELYAHLLRGNRARFPDSALPEGKIGRGATPWENLLRFASLFPEFRLQHGMDDIFLAWFRRVQQLLDRIAPVRLPHVAGTKQEGPACIHTVKRDICAAIRRFETSREYADLYLTALRIPEGFEALRQISHANKAAAFHVISVFEHVYTSRNTDLHHRYDALMNEYGGTLSSTERLMEFMDRLQKLDAQVHTAREEDFSRYLLSEEVEIVQELARRNGNRLDYVLPGTVNADESYDRLQTWVRQQGVARRREES